MWRNGHVVRLGHRGDLHDLQYPARVRDVGVKVVGRTALEHLDEAAPPVDRLADRYRDVEGVLDLGDAPDVLRRARLLEPVGPELLDHAADHDRLDG